MSKNSDSLINRQLKKNRANPKAVALGVKARDMMRYVQLKKQSDNAYYLPSDYEREKAKDKLKLIVKNTEEFERACLDMYGNRYDYSETILEIMTGKITIRCRYHGDFVMTARAHINGRHCPECVKGTNKLIKEFSVTHDGYYDYSNTLFARGCEKIKITCPLHGEFEQRLTDHKRGIGCKKCGIIKASLANQSTDFLEKALAVHGNRYNYDLARYLGARQKVIVSCDIHGLFFISAADHLSGSGCPDCGRAVASAKRVKKIDAVIAGFQKAHGKDRYDYSLVNYVNNKVKVDIICPVHSLMFSQRPCDHSRGSGCPKCGVEKSKRNLNNAKLQTT